MFVKNSCKFLWSIIELKKQYDEKGDDFVQELLKEVLEKVNSFGCDLKMLQEGQQRMNERLVRLEKGQQSMDVRLVRLEKTQLEMKERIEIVYNQTANLIEMVDEMRGDVEKI
ncbi:MAG: hypothetical protein LR001_10655 [Clostridiales bacterium]|nr:hypothetical protein [Clostridiales bacterium]